jgi:hypothetical protein
LKTLGSRAERLLTVESLAGLKSGRAGADNPCTMSSLSSLLSLLTHAVRAFFRHDVALRRGDGKVRLVLEDRLCQPAGKPPSRAEQAASKDTLELSRAREELARVLNEEPLSRSQLRHLAFVEHALEKKGWRALYKVPLNVLQHALEQLESLVTDWSPEGLACLRSKMAVAVIDREHQDDDPEADAYRTAAVLDNPPVLAAQAIESAMAPDEDEDAALLAAYAALGTAAPAVLEVQGELGSRSAKAQGRELPRDAGDNATAGAISLRDLHG